jgi:hypothetical protein
MGETTQFFRRWRHRKTTAAGILLAVAIGMRHIPDARPYADALEAISAVLLGTMAADARRLP